MSGALNSVFGGGNILGSLLSIASIAFPPMALATSLSNVLGQAIGKAVMQAVGQLIQESGMPKFLGAAIGQLVNSVIGSLTKQSDPAVDSAVQNDPGVQDWSTKFMQEMTDKIVDAARKGVARENEASGKPAGSKVGAGSWLAAIAEAMGSIAGDKAATMVELSQKMSDLAADGKTIGEKDTKGQQANAKEFSIVQSKFQAASQEFSILQNTFSNAIKSIGEGLTAMGRKG